MIDFHNHIIPEVDDGSKSIEESVLMLRHASKTGIKEVVTTIHLNHPNIKNDHIIYDEVLYKKKQLENKLSQENINIKIHLGAEIYIGPNMESYFNHDFALIGNDRNKYMLIEFPTILFPPKSV